MNGTRAEWGALSLVFAFLLAVSCGTTPPAPAVPDPVVQTEPAAVPDTPQPRPAEELPFDPGAVTAEVKQSTIEDVRVFIDRLNFIIRSRDYASWLGNLTDEYVAHYSDREVLAEISLDPALKRYNIVLRSLGDYFNYVVFPSRQSSRVDDIEFLDRNRIKVIWVDPRGERLVLYNIEKIGDTWKVAFWR